MTSLVNNSNFEYACVNINSNAFIRPFFVVVALPQSHLLLHCFFHIFLCIVHYYLIYSSCYRFFVLLIKIDWNVCFVLFISFAQVHSFYRHKHYRYDPCSILLLLFFAFFIFQNFIDLNYCISLPVTLSNFKSKLNFEFLMFSFIIDFASIECESTLIVLIFTENMFIFFFYWNENSWLQTIGVYIMCIH